MSDRNSKVRAVLSVILCGIILHGSAAFFMLGGFKVTTVKAYSAKSGEILNFYNDTLFEDVSSNTQNIPTTQVLPAQSEENAVAVNSDAVVKGRVIEKFISPYTANTSYENIYLKNSTDLTIKIKELLNEPLKYEVNGDGSAEVLLLHTHATESFLDTSRDYYTNKDLSRTNDESLNMIALGSIIKQRLESEGIGVIHDKTLHDYPSYNQSYKRAAKTINTQLKSHPEIKIILDIHRDAISSGDTDKVKVTSEIEGRKAAQVMLVMGSQSGNVTNYPNYRENLKLAVRFQQKLEGMYPSLARSISLNSKSYNQPLHIGAMLLEIGTDANSLEEVKYSAELVGNALCALLKEI